QHADHVGHHRNRVGESMSGERRVELFEVEGERWIGGLDAMQHEREADLGSCSINRVVRAMPVERADTARWKIDGDEPFRRAVFDDLLGCPLRVLGSDNNRAFQALLFLKPALVQPGIVCTGKGDSKVRWAYHREK